MREHLCKQKSSILQHVWQNMISVAFDTLSYSGISYFVHVSTYLSLFLKEMVSLQISMKSLSGGPLLRKWFCGCKMWVKKWYHMRTKYRIFIWHVFLPWIGQVSGDISVSNLIGCQLHHSWPVVVMFPSSVSMVVFVLQYGIDSCFAGLKAKPDLFSVRWLVHWSWWSFFCWCPGSWLASPCIWADNRLIDRGGLRMAGSVDTTMKWLCDWTNRASRI